MDYMCVCIFIVTPRKSSLKLLSEVILPFYQKKKKKGGNSVLTAVLHTPAILIGSMLIFLLCLICKAKKLCCHLPFSKKGDSFPLVIYFVPFSFNRGIKLLHF